MPPTIEELADARAEFVVVGGYAVAFHGHPRATKDIDILLRPDRADGKSKDVERLTGVSADVLREAYASLYEKQGDPTEWFLNDFGHKTTFLYRDANASGVRDKRSERIMGEMIHASPDNEAAAHLSR